MNLSALIKDFCPPILFRLMRRFGYKNNITFMGDYFSWEEAKLHASGYDAGVILQRARAAALKVQREEAVFERDSVCFYQEEYRWPALACLLTVAVGRSGKLNVLDFGGALGSFYFQHRKFLTKLKSIRWSVVEQAHFVECGKNEFQNENLRFYANVDECLATEEIDVIFLSGVLQYLEEPESTLIVLSEVNADYILIDRTPFVNDLKDRLTIQSVPESIYKASYPAWFFSTNKFEKLIRRIDYQIIQEFDGDDDVGLGQYKGYLLARS